MCDILLPLLGHPTPAQVIPSPISVLVGEATNDGFTGRENSFISSHLQVRDVLVKFGTEDAQKEAANLLNKLDSKTINAGAAS